MSAIEEDLEKIEQGTQKLQKEWERFFAGQEKKAPYEAKQRLERLIRRYIGVEIRNNIERFRFQTLSAKYNTLSDMWSRRLRAIEEGRPIAGVRGALRDPVVAPPPPPSPPTDTTAIRRQEVRISTLREDEDGVNRLYSVFTTACATAGEPALKLESFRKLIAQHRVRLLEEKDAVAVDFRISNDGGKVSLKAKPIRIE